MTMQDNTPNYVTLRGTVAWQQECGVSLVQLRFLDCGKAHWCAEGTLAVTLLILSLRRG